MGRPVEVSVMELTREIVKALPGMAPQGPSGDYKTDVAYGIATHLRANYLVLRNKKERRGSPLA